MNIDAIRELFDYNYWRNKKILSTAHDVTPEQFTAPNSFPSGSLHGTLVHTLGAEWIWRQRLQMGVSPKAIVAKDALPTLEAIQAKWAEEERETRAWLAALDDAALDEVKRYNMTNGTPVADKLWQCLAHVVNHGTQHCSEMAQMLTDYGHSPGNIDYIYFLRERE
jgi:uncharacterized damage-inducible protein DinB